MIVLPVVVFVVLMIAWLWAGRTLTLAVDWMVPFPVRSLAASPLSYRGIDFHLGGERLTVIMLNHEHADLQVATDRQNRVVLSMGRDAFVLGPRTNPVDPKDPLNVDFAADSGDQVRLTAHESLLSWPNPFEVNWLGGSVARWKKYVYYWLVWTKPTGARLEMRWRYQRDYYQRTGWTEPLMMYNWHTGLMSAEILPESKGPEGAIVRYIARTKGWNRSQYWIERRGASKDGQSEVFAVIRLCDRCLAEPMAGASVEVYVNRATEEVTKELGYQ